MRRGRRSSRQQGRLSLVDDLLTAANTEVFGRAFGRDVAVIDDDEHDSGRCGAHPKIRGHTAGPSLPNWQRQGQPCTMSAEREGMRPQISGDASAQAMLGTMGEKNHE